MPSRAKLNFLLPTSFLITACSLVLGSYGAETAIIKDLGKFLGGVSPEVIKGLLNGLGSFGINVMSTEAHPFLQKFLNRLRNTEITFQDNIKDIIEQTIFEVIKDELNKRKMLYESGNIRKQINSPNFFKGLLEKPSIKELGELTEVEILQIFDKNKLVFTENAWFEFLYPFFKAKKLDVPNDFVRSFAKSLERNFFIKIETFAVRKILDDDKFRNEIFFKFLKQIFTSQAEILAINNEILQIVVKTYEISTETLNKIKNLEEISLNNKETLKRIEGFLKNKQISVEDFPSIMELLENVLILKLPSAKFISTSSQTLTTYFTGREKDIERLKATLEKDKRASLFGLHGIGKTQFALKYADKFQNDYQHIIVVNAAKGVLLNSLAQVHKEFNLPLKSYSQPGMELSEQQNKAYGLRDFLQNEKIWSQENRKFLLILDNVDEIKEVRNYIPQNNQGHLLFTSNFSGITNLAKRFQLKEYRKSESILLLFRLAENREASIFDITKEKRDILRKIAEKLAYLPVLLENAGLYMKNRADFNEYLELLEKAPEIVIDYADELGIYHQINVRNAFQISFSEICQPKSNKDQDKLIAEVAKELLFACAILAPNNIPEELLQKYLEKHENHLSKITADKILWYEVRSKLTKLDLLSFNKEEKSYDMHKFVQLVIWKYLIPTEN